MDILDNFYVEDNKMHINKYKLVVRNYKTLEKTEYTDSTYYVNEAGMKEWTEQLVPKHQLLELILKEELDTCEYSWMEGVALRTDNHWKEMKEISSYGSMEAYKASLPESTDKYLLDLDCRISAVELGI